MSLSEYRFQLVSFVNVISTKKRGRCVCYVTNEIMEVIIGKNIKKDKNIKIKYYHINKIYGYL